MNCSNCGTEIKEGHKYCTKCGKRVDGAPSEANHDPAKDEKLTKGISWGFVSFPFFYTISMKFSGLTILGAFILQIIARAGAFGWLIYFVIAIPLAFRVKQQAYHGRRPWESDEQFLAVQKKWDRWGLAIFIIVIGLVVFGALYYMANPS